MKESTYLVFSLWSFRDLLPESTPLDCSTTLSSLHLYLPLDPSLTPFQLFLHHPPICQLHTPSIYCTLQAWTKPCWKSSALYSMSLLQGKKTNKLQNTHHLSSEKLIFLLHPQASLTPAVYIVFNLSKYITFVKSLSPVFPQSIVSGFSLLR